MPATKAPANRLACRRRPRRPAAAGAVVGPGRGVDAERPANGAFSMKVSVARPPAIAHTSMSSRFDGDAEQPGAVGVLGHAAHGHCRRRCAAGTRRARRGRAAHDGRSARWSPSSVTCSDRRTWCPTGGVAKPGMSGSAAEPRRARYRARPPSSLGQTDRGHGQHEPGRVGEAPDDRRSSTSTPSSMPATMRRSARPGVPAHARVPEGEAASPGRRRRRPWRRRRS